MSCKSFRWESYGLHLCSIDGAVRSQPWAHKPTHSPGDEFFTRKACSSTFI